ncbi:hypothetical protein QA645_41120 [Bradyrhizobium sp. CIAT3101]|uniref:hypothetical protein n=1 Tax=Bradyrhizobium sp. CIAT3101 TaxID=439387 RepID=UPI0024B1C3E9|nr:hypothetical protein [Bradyrhizobium sp. CIAT3101]WFU80751.1 hypothetical protein QA645_41120 [Bradyrhizobium sp. CIAT3101]
MNVYSREIVRAIEKFLEYKAAHNDNFSRPALQLTDGDHEEYLRELRRLVAELRRLNENLEYAAAAAAPKKSSKRGRAPNKQTEDSAIQVKKHLNTFLHSYASLSGKGAAALTTAAGTALLGQLGVPLPELVALVTQLHRT